MDSEQITMQTLRKFDPCITKKLYTSTFCSLFEHDEATKQWHSLEYEGSMYIVLRTPPLPPPSPSHKQ